MEIFNTNLDIHLERINELERSLSEFKFELQRSSQQSLKLEQNKNVKFTQVKKSFENINLDFEGFKSEFNSKLAEIKFNYKQHDQVHINLEQFIIETKKKLVELNGNIRNNKTQLVLTTEEMKSLRIIPSKSLVLNDELSEEEQELVYNP